MMVRRTYLSSQMASFRAPSIDLATKQTLKPADWVLTLEVGEHIPPQFMDTFLSNVVRHARHGVVMSWARPGQTRPGEPAHPNEVSNIRVIAEMKKLGTRVP